MSRECDIKCVRELPMYHFDQPPQILAEPPERQQLRFAIPDVPPGEYLIVVYDGSESGLHYTWETFSVTAGSPVEHSDTRSQENDSPASLWPLGAALLIAGLGAGWLIGRRTSSASKP
jgi:hypothetical protein